MSARLMRTAAMATALMMATACSDGAVAPTPDEGVGTLTINAPTAVVYEADAVVMTAAYRNPAGDVVPGAPITWTTADTNNVQLGGNGYVLALRNGTAKLTATSNGVSASYVLSIVRTPVQHVAVLLPASTLTLGDVLVVGVRVDGPGGRVVTGRAVSITSDNPNVASIDASGRVRALTAGVANIRATADGVTGSAQILVSNETTTLNLSKLDGNALPRFIAGDTIMVNGRSEYHEVYLESGTFSLAGMPLRYDISLRLAEYNVVIVNGRRELQLRLPQTQRDRGVVAFDHRGDLLLTSEVVAPLNHFVSPISGGMQMTYRIAGTDDTMQLFFRREPA